MKFYFIGLGLRCATHDYRPIYAALQAMQARHVSRRIWLCVVNQRKRDALTNIYRLLASNDEMMVVEVPENMNLPEAMHMAA